MLFKMINYLFGYVTIILPEEYLEKFINLATVRGIYLWGIESSFDNQVALNVRLRDVQPLRHIARMSCCRFHVIARHGLPFLVSRLKHRKTWVAGVLFFILVLYTLSSFIWFIDISGTKTISESKIDAVLRESGLHRGVLKWSVDEAVLEKNIMRQVDGLAWAGVTIDGTRLEIKVVEKVLPPEDENQLQDIVAAKDGLIKEILVLSGYPMVKEGATVAAGQVLISAESPSLETEEQPPLKHYENARGIVRARIWYDAYEEVKLSERVKEATGQEVTRVCMKVGSKEIILMGPERVDFELYTKETNVKRLPEWRNIRIPVELITIKYIEQEVHDNVLSRNQALDLAGNRAQETLRAQMPEQAKVLNISLREIKANDNELIVRVRLIVETLEEIGVEKPHLSDGGGQSIVDGKDGSATDGDPDNP